MNQDIEALKLTTKLRENNIKAVLEMNKRKIKKSFEFANKENIKYVIVVGEDEVAQKKYSLKNMETGNQELLSCDEIVDVIKNS